MDLDKEALERARINVHTIHKNWSRVAIGSDPRCYSCDVFAQRAIEEYLGIQPQKIID